VRVVSLVPSETEALFDLGGADLLVGRTDYCVEPAGRVETIPTVGGTKTPRVDDVLALRPDLVLANREENRKRHVEAIEAAGVRVHVSYPRTPLEAAALVRCLGALCDLPAAEDAARAIEAAIADARRHSPSPAPRVLVPIWWEPMMVASSDTFVAAMVEAAGGRTAIEGREARYPTISMDDVVALAPDVVLLPDEPYRFGGQERSQMLALPIPAARSGRIHLCDGKALAWYGARTGRDLPVIRRLLLHPGMGSIP
jgi:ABC-type hemin transport system substrate-binding protein